MNSIKKIILSVVLLSIVFISCSDGDDPKQPIVEYDNVAYIVNYGGYGAGNGEISTYNIEEETIIQNGYETANNVTLGSNIQSMAIYDETAYLMSNAGDKIDVLDAATLKAVGNPVSDDIVKPRYFAASEGFAYISCWGEVNDWAVMANSYIAKMDLETKAVTKIMLPGGPEGLYISNDKLYISSTTKNIVSVMDLGSETIIKEIEVSAIPQHFVEDSNENIWVSLVSKYSVPFPEDKLGFAVIDTKLDMITGEVNFAGMGADGMIAISPDKNKVYALGGGNWVEDPAGSGNWVQLPGGIFSVDVASEELDSDALIEGEKLNGLSVNPENGDIYVLVSPDTSVPGTLEIYASNGAKLSDQVTGSAPKHVVFYKIEKESK